MNLQELDQRIDRIVELRKSIRILEQELTDLLGGIESAPEQKKRRVVRYEKPLEKYVVEALKDEILTTAEIARRVKDIVKTTVLIDTIGNTVARLARHGMIEKVGKKQWVLKPENPTIFSNTPTTPPTEAYQLSGLPAPHNTVLDPSVA